MAANNYSHDLKTRIRRLFRRSPLSSCSCKSLADDVVVNWSSSKLLPRRHSFSTSSSSYYYDTPLLTSEVDGRKCPPSSPAIIPKVYKKKLENKKKQEQEEGGYSHNKKCRGFQRMHNNGLFELQGDKERLLLLPAEEEVAAVVKRSRDPYSDFRASMVEMIVEKQIFGAKDLENLLECFLSLNSRHHHKVIVQVFAEIWEALLL